MTKLQQHLNTIMWMDYQNIQIPEFAITPEYPSDFQQYFGAVPSYSLKFDTVLYRKNCAKLVDYLTQSGFIPVWSALRAFKLVHFERKIVLSVDIAEDDYIKENDEDDDGPVYRAGSDNEVYLHFWPDNSNKEFIGEIIKKMVKKFLKAEVFESNKFFMVAQNQKGLYSQKTTFKSIPITDDRFDLFYGEDFPHKKLKSFITDKTENLMLIHGVPGSGKSNYLKNIITNSPRKVIYIPPSMLSVIASPGFISYMMENQGSIILIEDAEEILSIDRNSATNNLLGVTSGFLKDSLNLKVICTFNCDIGKIDPALLRKGRLHFEYKFKALNEKDAQKLVDYMGLDVEVGGDMTLADIFNPDDTSSENSFEEKRMGFLT